MARICIELLSDLCAGSGESLGNVVDTDMYVDEFGLPVIPGRRLKGCLRKAAEELAEMELINGEDVEMLFGTDLNGEGKMIIGDAELECANELRAWLKNKDNEENSKVLKAPAQVSRLFTSIRGQTKLLDGIADPGSLRFTRVLNHISPMTGQHLIMVALVEAPEDKADVLKKCCQALRHMGMHRNRGLGWVKAEYSTASEAKSASETAVVKTELKDNRIRLEYRIALDANLVLTGADGQVTAIPGRSVIGCMAAAWLRVHSGKDGGDPEFRKLFLSGEVNWSDLTPVIDGKRSEPAPLMLAQLKDRSWKEENKKLAVLREGPEAAETLNMTKDQEKLKELSDKAQNPPKPSENLLQSKGDAVYGNRLTDWRFHDALMWHGVKVKTVEGQWAIKTKDGWKVAGVESDTRYHHRHGEQDETALYTHTSVPAGLIYGGIIDAPADCADELKKLLATAELRFGHSRNAQYARCSLWPMAADQAGQPEEELNVKKGEKVFVVLASNLLLSVDGLYALSNGEIREQIANALGMKVRDDCPDGCIDYVQYVTLGGYHAMWYLQKPRISAVAGGSVFCFKAAEDGCIQPEFRLGEYQQEGLGLCRVMSADEMENHLFVLRTQVDHKFIMEQEETDAQKAFHVAMLKLVATQTVSEGAVALAKKMRKENNVYKALDCGRLRIMIEEAVDPSDLKRRFDDQKTDSKKAAANALYSLVFNDNINAPLLFNPKYPGDDSYKKLVNRIDNLDEGVKRQFCEANWKQLLQMVLKMYMHGRKATGKEAQA